MQDFEFRASSAVLNILTMNFLMKIQSQHSAVSELSIDKSVVMPVAAHTVPVMVASTPFFLLQIAMICLICRRRRKDENLRSAFFTIYCAVSVADCTHLALVRLFSRRYEPRYGAAMISLSQGFRCSKATYFQKANKRDKMSK